MLKLLLVTTLLSHITVSNCQVIDGILLDELTKKPIAYVNIGILNTNIGTVSNEKGEFRIDISNSNYYNTIVFSSIAYTSKEIKVEQLINTSTTNVRKIYLAPQTYKIAEVTVKPKNVTLVKTGNGAGSKRKHVGFGPDDKLGSEVGTIIPIKRKDAYLEKVFFNIAVNNYGNIKLRLNIYSLKNGLPDEKLNMEPIYFETAIKKGKCIVDLEKYNLKIDNDIFISIEYIENMGEYGLYFTFSFNKNPTFMRVTSLSPWSEITYENKKVNISINAILAYERN